VQDIYSYYFIANTIREKNTFVGKCKIKKIACGGKHSLAITFIDDIVAWGYSDKVYKNELYI